MYYKALVQENMTPSAGAITTIGAVGFEREFTADPDPAAFATGGLEVSPSWLGLNDADK